MEAMSQTRQGNSILKNRNFLLLFIGSVFSAPGYYIYLIAAEWLMLTLSENRVYFGMLFFAASVPRLLLLAVGGVVADRFNKRTILFLSDLLRALLIATLLLFLYLDVVTAWHLIILATLFGIADAFSYPVTNSMTPLLLEEDQLQRGNSLIQMTMQISPILGPALGGTLIAVLGFQGVFSVACVMLLIGSLTVLFIQLKQGNEGKRDHSPWTELKEGLAYVRQSEFIMAIMFIAFFINFFFSGPFSIGMPIIVKDVFEGSAINLATIQTAMGVGAMVGAILLAVKKITNYRKVILFSLLVVGCLYTFTGISSHLYVSAILVLIMAALLQFVNIPIFTILQKTVDKSMLGRIMGLLVTVSTGLIPVSYVVTSTLIALGVDIRYIMIGGGIFIVIIAIISFKFKRLRNLRMS
ncbi:MFS transporter [Virgibacillus pantothenticus]|uniref:MFS transporter n=1 Tax=Virgibacillus pantothenticus TaxID=1473 RepID=UPI000985CC74|nr:MFS transporter [Virgibacillus pantothenticus]